MIVQSSVDGSTASRRLQSLLVVVGFLPLGLLMMENSRGANFDLQVYRNSLAGMLHGKSVYAFAVYNDYAKSSVGFSYPPFASLVMSPLALVPEHAAAVGLALTTTLLVLTSLAALVERINVSRRRQGQVSVGGLRVMLVATPLGMAIPTLDNMALGQVSFALGALVLLDVVMLPPRWKGVLVGFTSAVKLTSLILVPYYLVTRQWRAALNATAVFGIGAIVGAAFRWSDSVRYWLHPSVVAGSLGGLSRSNNWSAYGALSGMGLSGTDLTLAWAAVSIVGVVSAMWRARGLFRAGRPVASVVVVEVAGYLVTVATWDHHAFFLVVAVCLIAWQRLLVGALVVLAAGLSGLVPQFVLRDVVVPLMILIVVMGLPHDPRPQGSTSRLRLSCPSGADGDPHVHG